MKRMIRYAKDAAVVVSLFLMSARVACIGGLLAASAFLCSY